MTHSYFTYHILCGLISLAIGECTQGTDHILRTDLKIDEEYLHQFRVAYIITHLILGPVILVASIWDVYALWYNNKYYNRNDNTDDDDQT